MAGDVAKQRKLLSIDTDVLRALYNLSRDSGVRLDDLLDQALRGLLKKHGQPVTLTEALQQSTRTIAANDSGTKSRKRAEKKRRWTRGRF